MRARLHRGPDGDAGAEQRRGAVERNALGHRQAERLIHDHPRAVTAIGAAAVRKHAAVGEDAIATKLLDGVGAEGAARAAERRRMRRRAEASAEETGRGRVA